MTRVAILMPAFGRRELANLARDAIAEFTKDVAHDVFLLDHGAGEWEETGSDANFQALYMLRAAALWGAYSHAFIMHDDSLPLRAGWLSFLMGKLTPAAAIISQRSGRGHSAGTLFDWRTLQFADLEPKLPEYDVAESRPLGWGAKLMAWRGKDSCGDWRPPNWMFHHECDVALDDDGEPFYVHLGGGSIGAGTTRPNSKEHAARLKTWVKAARWALFDCTSPFEGAR